MLTFHNDKKVKAKYVSRLKAHAKADEFIKGKYWENGKGCAVGCTIHSSNHNAYEAELGIPEWLARLEDALFEGLEGKRSRLFFEIIRLVSEVRPRFVFLENVSAITVRGAERVVREFCRLRYDCRWGILSASDVGAPHKRDRWWFLANSRSVGGRRMEEPEIKGQEITQASREIPNTQSERCRKTGRVRCDESTERSPCGSETMADPKSKRDDGLQYWRKLNFKRSRKAVAYATSSISTGLPIRTETPYAEPGQSGWWAVEPNVGRVAHGVPARTHRLRALGNAVVPAQAREAFERLMGLA